MIDANKADRLHEIEEEWMWGEMDMAKAINAHGEWEASNGKCLMCLVDKPDSKGFHHNKSRHFKHKKYRCENAEGCTLCHGCLPPGEICRACHRLNVYQHEC